MFSALLSLVCGYKISTSIVVYTTVIVAHPIRENLCFLFSYVVKVLVIPRHHPQFRRGRSYYRSFPF